MAGYAGFRKERELPAALSADHKSGDDEFAPIKGLVVAFICGLMSACFAFGIQSGVPIAELAVEAEECGLFVLDAGYTMIPPNSPYPPVEHPDAHMFSWESGRTLESFTLVYITRGGGVFESSSGGRQTIREGDLFIIHPGEWHRHQPDPATG